MKNKNSNDSEMPVDKKVNIGKDVSDSVIVTGNKNVINVGKQEKHKSEAATARRAVPSKAGKKTTKRKLSTPVVIALIGFAGVAITALFTSPLIERLLFSTSAPSSTPTISLTDSVTATQAPVIGETLIVSPTFTLTPGLEYTATASPSSESPSEQMNPFLSANLLEGKAPLKINFDARDSFVQFADGSSVACGSTRLCSYTFTVRLENQVLCTEDNVDGVFSYKFERRGQHSVSVRVCRAGTCGAIGIIISIR
jgi:hypothetical protein